MFDYKADIVSGKSLGNFQIGENINDYLPCIYEQGIKLNIKKYNENQKNEIHSYLIDNNFKINTLPNGYIINITSINSYKGTLNKIIKSGITVEQIKIVTEKQTINNGCLFLNGDYGFCYILPTPYDEIGDTINQLPNDLILNEICVGNFFWWFDHNLIPEYAK